ncbi:MAG TPA: RNA polymerase sigma factor RpoH [Stellaceae bacterium]|nr:RNA polymerase sigma factor RpoH [Stellaceae bacterium]
MNPPPAESGITTVRTLAPVARLASESGLSLFLREIRQFPMLAPETEYALARRWRRHGDIEAAHQLVTSHLRLVAKMALGYRGYGLPLPDLISEGSVGLMQAVKRFDPERGFRLATYAMWWIRASIQEYVLRSWSLVKMGTTAAQKKLFFSLRRIKGRLKAIDDGDLRPETVRTIARELAVPEADIVEMNRRLAAHDSSLNNTFAEDGTSEWIDQLADERAQPDTVVADAQELGLRRDLLNGAMAKLSVRERGILAARRLDDPPQTLEQLGATYGVSRERIRQIEERAYAKVLQGIKTAISDRGLVMQ